MVTPNILTFLPRNQVKIYKEVDILRRHLIASCIELFGKCDHHVKTRTDEPVLHLIRTQMGNGHNTARQMN